MQVVGLFIFAKRFWMKVAASEKQNVRLLDVVMRCTMQLNPDSEKCLALPNKKDTELIFKIICSGQFLPRAIPEGGSRS